LGTMQVSKGDGEVKGTAYKARPVLSCFFLRLDYSAKECVVHSGNVGKPFEGVAMLRVRFMNGPIALILRLSVIHKLTPWRTLDMSSVRPLKGGSSWTAWNKTRISQRTT
jgi:hypothetical protein